MTEHKYDLDRRYQFEATADSACPVDHGTKVAIWMTGKCVVMHTCQVDENLSWQTNGGATITHFLVTSYPPEKHKAWVNVYSNSDMRPNYSKERADQCANDKRRACIKIEWTEGEGL
ncbi:MAG: hypothetical protein COA96_10325 [SAR86 cluster bacterium]|uniref:Uncharacterized protein n=1 Tax=SAR86 cluster bacterium TaxID=2030880 RepID=A0A2A5AY05_9GAMM|nr:MAG: hypothetical protein COA96_10325 [SAR86 cluster bacterium]